MMPALYSSVTLSSDSHIEQFSSILESFNVQVAPLVKELTIAQRGKDINESILVLLEPHVSKLVSLAKLDWSLYFVPENLKLITLFQNQCPNLSSVDLSLPEGFKFKSKLGRSQYATLLGFKNLIEFRLEIAKIPFDLERDHISPLRTLLFNTPRLRTLKLYLEREDDLFYSPDSLVESLGNELQLPDLHRLELTGNVELDSGAIFSSPEQGSHPFRDFLSRHPNIENLKLGCSSVTNDGDEINPHYLSLALPSLKHFVGSDHICDQLIRSTVASQLHTLNIQQSCFEQGVDFLPSKIFPVLPLPSLRRLEIGADDFCDALEIMKIVLPATDKLEELRITTVPHHYHRAFLGLVIHTPNLKEIAMYNFGFSMMRAMSSVLGIPHIPIPGEEEAISHEAALKQKLKILCPRLRTINGKVVNRA